MIKINITNTLAVIAICISLFSVWLSYVTYWRTKPKLKITFPDRNSNLSFKPLKDDKYVHPGRCCIFIEIANMSSKPISISEFLLFPDDKDVHYTSNHFSKASDVYVIDVFDDEQRKWFYTQPIGKMQLLPPIYIDAYSIKLGFIFFLTDEPHHFTGTLVIKTPFKDFKEKLIINLVKKPSLATVRVNSMKDLSEIE